MGVLSRWSQRRERQQCQGAEDPISQHRENCRATAIETVRLKTTPYVACRRSASQSQSGEEQFVSVLGNRPAVWHRSRSRAESAGDPSLREQAPSSLVWSASLRNPVSDRSLCPSRCVTA